MRLLVRMPTRSRPIRALEVLKKYRDMAGCDVKLEVVIDVDDETMHTSEVQEQLHGLDCTVTVGAHKSKVEACNAGAVDDWDVLLLASDDMVPVVDGYGVRIVAAMKKYFPALDGAVYFYDGAQKHVCTLPIMGRRLWKRLGYVYDPAYASLFCDTEYTDILKPIGKLVYVDEKIIEHQHHTTGKTEVDALYIRNDNLWRRDELVYNARNSERKDLRQRLSTVAS